MENMQGDIPVCVQSGSVYWICTSLYASIVFDLKCHGPPIRCKGYVTPDRAWQSDLKNAIM